MVLATYKPSFGGKGLSDGLKQKRSYGQVPNWQLASGSGEDRQSTGLCENPHFQDFLAYLIYL